MKKILMILISMTLVFSLVGFVGSASATTIDFDDLSAPVWVTDQYSALGINFAQTMALDHWPLDYAPVKHEGDQIAASVLYNSSIFTFDFVLGSFDILVAGSNIDLYLDAYDISDNLVRSTTQYIPMGVWNPMSIDLTGVSATKIVLHDSAHKFGFDNVSFEESSIEPEPEPEAIPNPEPATMLLLGFGLVGFGFVGIRGKLRKN